MKSARTLITLCLLITAASLFAQTTPSQRLMTVNIPFAFSAGNATLPAGQYLLYTISPAWGIRFATIDGRHNAFVTRYPSTPANLRRTAGWCSIGMATSTFWSRSGLRATNWSAVLCPASGRRRLPAAAVLNRHSRSSHTPIAANEFAVIEPSGRVHRRALFSCRKDHTVRDAAALYSPQGWRAWTMWCIAHGHFSVRA